MCSSYQDLSAHPGGFAGLVLPLSKCLVIGIPRLIGSSWETEYPSLIARAYNGLSWDTPAGFELSKAVPVVMWQMGICECPVVENLKLISIIKIHQPRV